MRPGSLGDRVPEPLMGGLVAHHALPHRPVPIRLGGIEDGGRVLHAAVAGGRLDVRQLLVGKGTGQTLHDLDDVRGAAERDRIGERRVAGKRPHLHRDGVAAVDHRAVAADAEPPGSDHHDVGGKRVRGGPGPHPTAPRRPLHAEQLAGGHDATIGRGVDGELDRRLVARGIDGRQPVTGALGPVVAERRADQSVLRRAVVGDGHLIAAAPRSEPDLQGSVGVREPQRPAIAAPDRIHRQSDEVERAACPRFRARGERRSAPGRGWRIPCRAGRSRSGRTGRSRPVAGR